MPQGDPLEDIARRGSRGRQRELGQGSAALALGISPEIGFSAAPIVGRAPPDLSSPTMTLCGELSSDSVGGSERTVACNRRIPPPLTPALLATESSFYGRYRWCLDAFPTVGDLRGRLRDELSKLTDVPNRPNRPDDWRRDEVLLNVFLLSCAVADVVDDYLAGDRYDLSPAAAVLPGLHRLARAVDGLSAGIRHWRGARLRRLRRWRDRWGASIHEFLTVTLASRSFRPDALAPAAGQLDALLDERFGARLLARRSKIPAAFRTQDITHHDVLALADRFAAAFPDRERPVLIVGLRTAGSYFAPLVRAALAAAGYGVIEAVTLRPKKGLAPWEQAPLARCAARGGLAVLVDESPDTGATLSRVIGILRCAGIAAGNVVALLPIHPTRSDWQSGSESLPLADVRVLGLDSRDWHKQRLLEKEEVERRLQPYFLARGYASASIVESPDADRFNLDLHLSSDQQFHTRLKRVYEVQLRSFDGGLSSRHVLAKSVGWGWLSYHAFLASEALSEFVPPVLGLRDGILYSEWLPQAETPALQLNFDRHQIPVRLASYVAARVRALALDGDPTARPDRQNQKGAELLGAALSGAFGWKPAAALKRARLQRELSLRSCPVPTLIDGKMRVEEWVRGPDSILKTDFEQHGMGKTELNVTDPAYDLAEAILHFRLSPAEEQAMLQHYLSQSGDAGVEERLFFHKLLAGTAAMNAALFSMKDSRLRHRHQEFNLRYIEAWEFMTSQAVRFSGALCRPEAPPQWRSPIVVMDVDGVLDKQIFGFPTTTAAGIEALRLLHAHGMTICLNTARTLSEVQDYCRAYGLSGGVAEYGAVVWDGVRDRAQVLVSQESLDELRRLSEALRRLPGVFLNPRYLYSLRAYTYERGRTIPLPAALVKGLAQDLRLERLAVRQTHLDTTVVAVETDKGKGLLALLELAKAEGAETIAIGDSEPDLPMFRVAGRSFAPRQISGRGIAQLLGCQIASRSYQPGLLRAVRSIVHNGGGPCSRCEISRQPRDGLWWSLLETADQHPLRSLVQALADPRSVQVFRR